MKTKGEVEAVISEAMVQFEVEYMGRGPKEVRSFVIEDMILVRLKGVLTQAEQPLAKSSEGVDPIKRLRTTLIKMPGRLSSKSSAISAAYRRWVCTRTSARLAVGRALIGVMVGELYAATAGIGFMITVAGATFPTDKVFVDVMIFAITGMVCTEVLDRLEGKFDEWRPKVGSDT